MLASCVYTHACGVGQAEGRGGRRSHSGGDMLERHMLHPNVLLKRTGALSVTLQVWLLTIEAQWLCRAHVWWEAVTCTVHNPAVVAGSTAEIW